MATALETSLASLASSQAALTAAISRIVSCCSNNSTPTPTTAPPTPAPTNQPSNPPYCTYTATLEEQQTTTCYSLILPKGFVNATIENDGTGNNVTVQSDNGNGAVIRVYVSVGSDKRKRIYDITSYESVTTGKITIQP